MLCGDGNRGNLGEVNLDGPIELQLIEQGVGRRGGGITVLELEVAELGLDRLGAEPAVKIGGLPRQGHAEADRGERHSGTDCEPQSHVVFLRSIHLHGFHRAAFQGSVGRSSTEKFSA